MNARAQTHLPAHGNAPAHFLFCCYQICSLPILPHPHPKLVCLCLCPPPTPQIPLHFASQPFSAPPPSLDLLLEHLCFSHSRDWPQIAPTTAPHPHTVPLDSFSPLTAHGRPMANPWAPNGALEVHWGRQSATGHAGPSLNHSCQ